MSSQVVVNGGPNGSSNGAANGAVNGTAKGATHHASEPEVPPEINLGSFHWGSVDEKFNRLAAHAGRQETQRVLAETPRAAVLLTPPPSPPPSLGPLSQFKGAFTGKGFNTIWRPTNGATVPGFPNDALLELNLTSETLTFSPPLGDVPNRGFGRQPDIHLNGVPYAQAIDDVTNPSTGKGDATGDLVTHIHFEPGVWMHVPSSSDPVEQTSLTRMASIPHGTTINAQGVAPTGPIQGGPQFKKADITPFLATGTQAANAITFPQQTLTNTTAPRLPQDLSLFNTAGTITQPILNDINSILQNAITGQNIKNTTVLQVSTTPKATALANQGTANINFLTGDNNQDGPNANAVSMSAIFWIETVQYQITVPPFKGTATVQDVTPPAPNPAVPLPTFEVHAGSSHITKPTTITVNATQIQYSQQVFLNFNNLSWPHISVATLVPAAKIPVVLASSS